MLIALMAKDKGRTLQTRLDNRAANVTVLPSYFHWGGEIKAVLFSSLHLCRVVVPQAECIVASVAIRNSGKLVTARAEN